MRHRQESLTFQGQGKHSASSGCRHKCSPCNLPSRDDWHHVCVMLSAPDPVSDDELCIQEINSDFPGLSSEAAAGNISRILKKSTVLWRW